MSNPLTEAEIGLSHSLDDALTELARHKRAVAEARDMLADALHAHRAGVGEVVDEYLDRVLANLGRL